MKDYIREGGVPSGIAAHGGDFVRCIPSGMRRGNEGNGKEVSISKKKGGL